MLTRVIAVGLVLSLPFWTGAASAQSDALMQAYERGKTLKGAGRESDAVPYYREALRLGERELGADHPMTAILLYNLALLYKSQGRHSDAEPLLTRSLAISEMVHGPNHPKVAEILNSLALVYEDLSRYRTAAPLRERALTILETALGPEHPKVADGLNDLAFLYKDLGRYSDAESLYIRALAITEKTRGAGHPDVALTLNNLAALYGAQGRYSDAEPLHKRSLEIKEIALGKDHPSVATSLNNLAYLYEDQGRDGEAEPLYIRALEIFKKTRGPDHPDTATGLNNLAALYDFQGRFDDAQPLYERALAIKEKVLGADHPSLAAALNNLAFLYVNLGRYEDAEPLYERALAIKEKVLGKDHPDVALGLNNLAGLYDALRRYDDSEPLYLRSLAIKEKTLGADHPGVALILNNLAVLYYTQRQTQKALEFIRKAGAIHRKRALRQDGQRSGGRRSEQKHVAYVFMGHVLATWAALRADPSESAILTAEAFEAGQLARATSTAAAVAGMGARFAAGDDALANLVRQRQDTAEQWRRTDKALIDAVGRPPDKRDSAAENDLRRRLSKLDRRLRQLDDQVTREYPSYAELTSPRPVSLADAQRLLKPDEALMAYVSGLRSTYLWVVRRDGAEMHRVAIGAEALNDAVAELRGGLDPGRIESLADLPKFDTTLAHDLYGKLFSPAEAMLDGVRHVFVVPDAALQSLPLGVLITEEPAAAASGFEGYRTAPWLARRYAMSVLPSVSSLRALRRFAKRATAVDPFMGFGDPVLKGGRGTTRGIELSGLFRGALADVDAVRNLPPLPDTADELRALSAAVQGLAEHIYLGGAATETKIKGLDLSDSRVVAFATHGLVAGDLENVEPALVLTPPETATAHDDGLLTASEVAQLTFNAELVILSACNTAAGDDEDGAEGLSGLAKAFFHAGSRALLVSHWPVWSGAAVELTTGMLGYATDTPAAGTAEALRQSMLALIANIEKPHWAHPLFWGPFVVVGEGGAYAAK